MKFCGLIACCFFLISGTASAAPQIVVEQPLYNFGTLVQGKKLDHTFVIKNIGDAPLKINHIRPACGCTAANASVPVMLPGKTSEIKISFNSANFYGTVTKTVAVETNDPKTPTSTLTLTGTITEEVAVLPKQLNLGQVRANQPKTITISVENRGSKPLKLVSLRSPMPQVSLRSDKTSLRSGESATVTVTVTPRQEDRMLSGYLSITTDSTSKPEVMIPIYGSLAR
ncbi:MAG: DUF1573 domain-containing protein [Geobacter sp.]|nr:DUF1573 domain-containing protein [Geobacter sp.]